MQLAVPTEGTFNEKMQLSEEELAQTNMHLAMLDQA
jgi:hypothetical protein